jgi:hypothetical protein
VRAWLPVAFRDPLLARESHFDFVNAASAILGFSGKLTM